VSGFETPQQRTETNMSTTNSIGIMKWANGMEISEIGRSGSGDNQVVAWRRVDGQVAIETNGDPVFGDEAEQWISENLTA